MISVCEAVADGLAVALSLGEAVCEYVWVVVALWVCVCERELGATSTIIDDVVSGHRQRLIWHTRRISYHNERLA